MAKIRNPDRTIHCYVCNKEIGLYGWPSHVKAEKKKYGAYIYILKRLQREEARKPKEQVSARILNHGLLRFEEAQQ